MHATRSYRPRKKLQDNPSRVLFGMDGEPFMCDDYQIGKRPMLRTLMPMDSLEILRKRLNNEQYAFMALVHDSSDPADACMLSQMLSVSEEGMHFWQIFQMTICMVWVFQTQNRRQMIYFLKHLSLLNLCLTVVPPCTW